MNAFSLVADAIFLGSISAWFGCLFVTCMLLEEKGRSGFGGFISYLLFPIAALIYAAAVPRRLPQTRVVSAGQFASEAYAAKLSPAELQERMR
jgi:hypothetical protein